MLEIGASESLHREGRTDAKEGDVSREGLEAGGKEEVSHAKTQGRNGRPDRNLDWWRELTDES